MNKKKYIGGSKSVTLVTKLKTVKNISKINTSRSSSCYFFVTEMVTNLNKLVLSTFLAVTKNFPTTTFSNFNFNLNLYTPHFLDYRCKNE